MQWPVSPLCGQSVYMLAMTDFVYEADGPPVHFVVSQRLHVEDAVVGFNVRIFSQLVEMK